MEYLNRIEVKGVAGLCRTTTFDNNQAVHFSLSTEYCYKTKDGMNVVETTWFSVTGFKSEGITQSTIDLIKKGNNVYVVGRVRQQRYVGGNGIEQSQNEIMAQTISIIN